MLFRSYHKKPGINLTKELKDVYSKVYETLMKEMEEDTKKSKYISPSWMGSKNTVKMSTLLKTIYICNEIPITLTKTFVTELQQIIPRFVWNDKDSKQQKQN